MSPADDAPAPRELEIVLAGATGRMGQLASETLAGEADLHLVGSLGRREDPALQLDRLPTSDRPRVLLDLSHAEFSRQILPRALERGLSAVVGTSGLLADDFETLAAACETHGVAVLVVPNFSVGAVLQMQSAERLARRLPCLGIHEIHHPAKRDAPSGTARETARRIARAAAAAGLQNDQGDQDGRGVPITSERTEGVLARQTVTFGSGHETVVLDHEVRDRRVYMPGLLLAVRAVAGLRGLSVGLDMLLDPDHRPDRGLAPGDPRLV